MSTSIGIAFFEAGMAPDELIRRADQAMYVAKRAGRDRFEVASAPWSGAEATFLMHCPMSEYLASADDADQDDDHGHDQENVDQSTGSHGSDHAEQPQDDEYDSDGIEHF